ncbi:hypothetical protein PLUA15_470128 [Pseudomonas lundensis]|uniref:Uncharacterized protein n=1 Tax=Pseudomonas lundensis TaxID=86185 RepID=A0AAX2HC88_9PSED|nr:hypothetical protein PLUA15_470128 [Pseudomonas lundensis]
MITAGFINVCKSFSIGDYSRLNRRGQPPRQWLSIDGDQCRDPQGKFLQVGRGANRYTASKPAPDARGKIRKTWSWRIACLKIWESKAAYCCSRYCPSP